MIDFLTAGQIYLAANPLLREPLRFDHVKPRLLGRWHQPGLVVRLPARVHG